MVSSKPNLREYESRKWSIAGLLHGSGMGRDLGWDEVTTLDEPELICTDSHI